MEHFTNEDIYQIGDFEKSLCYKVDKDTVGQYTELHDKNGKEIYEGDIVLIDKENNIKGIVKYSEVFAQFIIVNTNSFADEAEPLGDYEDLEILGNEYENPELLEENRNV